MTAQTDFNCTTCEDEKVVTDMNCRASSGVGNYVADPVEIPCPDCIGDES